MQTEKTASLQYRREIAKVPRLRRPACVWSAGRDFGGQGTAENPQNKREIEQSLARSQSMLRIVDNVRTIIQNKNEYIYIPDLRSYANS